MSELEFRDQDGAVAVYWGEQLVGGCRIGDGRATVAQRLSLPRPLLREWMEQLRDRGVVQLDVRALLLRYEARAMGFGGPLRAPLTLGVALPDDFVAALASLLPDVAIAPAPHQRGLRQSFADLRSGMKQITRITATPADGLPELVIAFPRRADQNVEAIAATIDTALGIHRRFRAASRHVRTISFDVAGSGMLDGKTAGAAPRLLGHFHLNAAYSFAEGTEWLESTAGVVAALHRLDGTVAHEMWHKIELAWEAERFAETVEFRRAVGALFGCDTIEHVFRDASALAALTAGVSNYAGTNRIEATAEMFKLLWCGAPAPGSIAARFGEIVDRFFPA